MILDHSDQDAATVKERLLKGEYNLLSLRDMDIDVEELEAKLCYLQDAIEEYEMILQLFEFVEGPYKTAKHQDTLEAQPISMLNIKNAVQHKIGLPSAVEIEVALADMKKVILVLNLVTNVCYFKEMLN